MPVGLAALLRAIELNGVAVETNKTAFSLGRLAAADPAALRASCCSEPAAASAAGGDARRADRARVRASSPATRTRPMPSAIARTRRDGARSASGARRRRRRLPLTRAVARSLLKLMAYKDEYEVARLYTDGEFREQLAEQFEGDLQLEFHMAPPVLARAEATAQPPRKMRFGAWMLPAMKLLARGKAPARHARSIRSAAPRSAASSAR